MKVVLNFFCVSFVNVFTFLIEWKREKEKKCQQTMPKFEVGCSHFQVSVFCSLLVRRTFSTFTVFLWLYRLF
jgi:hypothetical protein